MQPYILTLKLHSNFRRIFCKVKLMIQRQRWDKIGQLSVDMFWQLHYDVTLLGDYYVSCSTKHCAVKISIKCSRHHVGIQAQKCLLYSFEAHECLFHCRVTALCVRDDILQSLKKKKHSALMRSDSCVESELPYLFSDPTLQQRGNQAAWLLSGSRRLPTVRFHRW